MSEYTANDNKSQEKGSTVSLDKDFISFIDNRTFDDSEAEKMKSVFLSLGWLTLEQAANNINYLFGLEDEKCQ